MNFFRELIGLGKKQSNMPSIEDRSHPSQALGGMTKSLPLNLSLQSSDAVYFMLTLACSANIGSALTHTGNPQNMIVASDSLGVMPPIKFLYYMFLPTILSWLGTTWYISYCWVSERRAQAVNDSLGPNVAFRDCCPGLGLVARYPESTIGLSKIRSTAGSSRFYKVAVLDLRSSTWCVYVSSAFLAQ